MEWQPSTLLLQASHQTVESKQASTQALSILNHYNLESLVSTLGFFIGSN